MTTYCHLIEDGQLVGTLKHDHSQFKGSGVSSGIFYRVSQWINLYFVLSFSPASWSKQTNEILSGWHRFTNFMVYI